jgi:hypothetical protein
MIPAYITITNVSGNTAVRSVIFTITPATWSLYYKEIGTGNKRVEFIDGTVFTVDTDGTKLTVTRCPRGLDGTYTKRTDTSGVVVYKEATDINKVASCNWEKRVFSIGVESGTIDCGNRVYVGNTGGPQRIEGHAATDNDSAKKQPSVRFVFSNTTDACTTGPSFHPFAEKVFPISRDEDAEVKCHTNSVSKDFPRFSCLKQRWRVTPGEDIPNCLPGPKQRFINVSGFTRAETIFNGAYENVVSRSAGNTWPVWTHKTNDKIRIEVSKTEGNKLEIRDFSSAVWYTIKIVPSSTPGSNPTLEVFTNTKPPFVSLSTLISPTSSIITAVFSETDTGFSPCDLWSQCVEENSMKDGALSNGVLTCMDSARRCATVSSNPELTSIELRLSSVATVGIKLYPMVKGDGKGALYGRDPGTGSSDTSTLYVVVPDGQKGKVLVIPQTAADATVRDAALVIATSKSTWTIDSQAVPEPTDKQTSGPEKQLPGTEKQTSKPTDKPATETTSELQCDDLVECATTATTLSFSSCAAKAVACESNRPKDLVPTDSLTHGDEKGIKLFKLNDEVLYGADAVNAYVVLVRKEKVLVAPRDNKTDATVLDVAKEGTVWTSKTGISMMVWIGIGLGIFGFIVVVVLLFLVTRRSDDESYQGYTELRHADSVYDSSYAVPRSRPRILRPLADINSGVPTTTTTPATTAQGPKP